MENRVRVLLASQVNWHRDKITGNRGKDGRIHHAEAAHAVHTKTAVENSLFVFQVGDVGPPWIGADSTCARGMVSPCLLHDPIGQGDGTTCFAGSRLNLRTGRI